MRVLGLVVLLAIIPTDTTTAVPADDATLTASAGARARPDRSTMDSTRATGTFDVTLTPQPTDASPLGRMRIDKQFHGDLEGTGRGEMLAFSSDVEGSAGYVAMERVTGTLHGRRGSFVLQHSGTMERGAQHLQLTVVPDSGTGQLTGLSGSMQIIIAEGTHSYVFDYTLPDAAG